MRNITVREFIRNYENGNYEKPDFATMVEAGWYDWFCGEEELKPRLDALFPKVKQLAQSHKINMDTMYVFFKNNCPGRGEIYDDFRFCEIRTSDVVYTVTPASGHTVHKDVSELWGKENDFQGAITEGTWDDIVTFFRVHERNGIYYKDTKGKDRFIGKFGTSTQHEFDTAISELPTLIANARQGDEEAGKTANELLWQLANEGFNTRRPIEGSAFKELFPFGKQAVSA